MSTFKVEVRNIADDAKMIRINSFIQNHFDKSNEACKDSEYPVFYDDDDNEEEIWLEEN